MTDSAASTVGRHSALPEVVMEYTGGKALSVVGPVTGNRYRFEHPGARVGVDARDRRALATIPALRVL
jgi:hypothetical protein